MTNPARKSELVLILFFLAVIFTVPIVQTCLEVYRGDRVQATDVFRYKPTAKNLRQYEHTLEDKSWFQQTLRPKVQEAAFAAFRDTGVKGVWGRANWLFYRPDIRFLVEPNRIEVDNSDATWVKTGDGRTQRDNVLQAIIHFRDQLKVRGIQLLVMPVPGKPSVYPEMLTRRLTDAGEVQSPTRELLYELQNQGVATVDLLTAFLDYRHNSNQLSNASELYLVQDTHWTPVGSKLAAETTANKLNKLGWSPAPTNEFNVRACRVKRVGDVLEMMQIPKLRQDFAPETVLCEQISDPALGPLVPAHSDRPGTYRYPGGKSSILVLGDSFCRIYQFPEPASLGELNDPAGDANQTTPAESSTKRLLPGSAGFISQLARMLKAPVDAIVSDGGASTDVRKKLSMNPEILEGKNVVIWEFVERDIALGKMGWEDVPLPIKLGN